MNKQQLSEALAAVEPSPILDLEKGLKGLPILAAARLVERLLPGECGNCHGDGYEHDHDWTVLDMACLVCHGSGRVWDEGIVEAVAKVICRFPGPGHNFECRDLARAALSALVELLTEKVKR